MKNIKNVKELMFEEYSVYNICVTFEYEGMRISKSKHFTDLKKAFKFINNLYDIYKMPIIISGGTGKRNIVNRHIIETDLEYRMDNEELYNKLLSYPNI